MRTTIQLRSTLLACLDTTWPNHYYYVQDYRGVLDQPYITTIDDRSIHITTTFKTTGVLGQPLPLRSKLPWRTRPTIHDHVWHVICTQTYVRNEHDACDLPEPIDLLVSQSVYSCKR